MGCGGSKEATGSRKYTPGHHHHHADRHPGDDAYQVPYTAGPLTAREYKERLVTSEGTQSVTLPRSGYTIRYAYVSQRGYYPDSPDKANQDSFCVHTSFNGDPEQHLFGVFDGHGDCGTQSSQFARDKVPLNLLSSAHFTTNPALAFHQAMVATNLQCHRSDFDDSMSGTTAITVLIRGRSLLVANVGDSRAVLAEKKQGEPGYIARDLSIDQTPYRKDEAERVKAAGARVLTLDQVEGLKDPTIECWSTEEDDDGDPPRLWFPNGMYPGTAFTRSIGDAAAERIGVFAEPELEFRHLGSNHAFLVIASDGVFEFISSQRVVDMVAAFDDPHEACLSVVAESYRLWLKYETRTDDITMIMLQLIGLDQPPPSSTLARSSLPLSRASLPMQQAYQQQPNASVMAAAAAAQQQEEQHQQEQQQEAAAAAAAAAVAAQQQQQQLGLIEMSQQGIHLQPGNILPLRGHLVEDIEAYNLAAAAAAPPGFQQQQQQQQHDKSLTTISKWFQSHNYVAPGNDAAQLAPSGAGKSTTAAAAAAAAAAGMAAAAAQQQQQELDLESITQQQYRMLEQSVKHNFLFSHLSEAERLTVYKAMQRVTVQPNEVIISQGERGDDFYVVEAGVFDVMVASSPEQIEALAIEEQLQQQELQELQQQQQDLAAKLQQQQLGNGQQQQQQQPAGVAGSSSSGTPRAAGMQQQRQQQQYGAAAGKSSGGGLTGSLRGSGNLLVDNDLMADIAANAAGEAFLNALEDGQEGGGGPGSVGSATTTAPGEFGILGGIQTEWGELVHTYCAPPMEGPEDGGAHPSFGELALLYGKPRAATVVSQTDGVLWRLSRQAFRSALQAGRSGPDPAVLHTLRSCELLECLTNGQLVMLAGLLQPRVYEDGDVITQQGDTADDSCFIVAQGEVVAVVCSSTANLAAAAAASSPQTQGLLSAAVSGAAQGNSSSGSRDGYNSDRSVHGGRREVLTMGPGAFFGERNLADPSFSWLASMVARGRTLLLAISRSAFEGMFGPLSTLAADHAAWQTWLGKQRELLSRSVVLGPKHEQLLAGKFDPQALHMRGVLWMLSGGAVLASLEEPQAGLALTGRLFCVEAVQQRGLSEAVMRMRRLTASLPPCLFVPHTVAAWRSPEHGQAVVAGEALATVGTCTLAALLQGGPLDERSAAYVTAMAVLGLSHLHRLGIAYRGLSAITLLVTEGGLVQLVDFRFAKAAQGRTFTLCGVPEYLAPEVVGGTGHDESVDLWALGVLVYHLITGGTPFAHLGDDELRIYRRILRAKFHWPDTPAGHDISADARDLVAQLLQRDPSKRLGMGRGGFAKLRAHPWFRSINWADLQEGRSMVPLGLRERLFHSGGGGELGFWTPQPREAGAPNPSWLEEF